MKTRFIPLYLGLVLFCLTACRQIPTLFQYVNRAPDLVRVLTNPLAFHYRPEKVSVVGGRPSETSEGWWQNEYNVVHVVHTRFLQHQPDLHHSAEARLKLFRTFTLPSMLQQTTKQYLWIIWTDPSFSGPVLQEVIRIVSRIPNAVLVADDYYDQGSKAATDFRSLYNIPISDVNRYVVEGNAKLLMDYHAASQSSILHAWISARSACGQIRAPKSRSVRHCSLSNSVSPVRPFCHFPITHAIIPLFFIEQKPFAGHRDRSDLESSWDKGKEENDELQKFGDEDEENLGLASPVGNSVDLAALSARGTKVGGTVEEELSTLLGSSSKKSIVKEAALVGNALIDGNGGGFGAGTDTVADPSPTVSSETDVSNASRLLERTEDSRGDSNRDLTAGYYASSRALVPVHSSDATVSKATETTISPDRLKLIKFILISLHRCTAFNSTSLPCHIESYFSIS
jgi:hypothetical protein